MSFCLHGSTRARNNGVFVCTAAPCQRKCTFCLEGWAIFGSILPALLLTVPYFWSGQSRATFLCVLGPLGEIICASGPSLCSFLLWLGFVCVECYALGPRHHRNLYKQTQTQKQPTQTVFRTEESMQWAQNKRNLQRKSPGTKEIYTNKAQNIKNLHKQCPDTRNTQTTPHTQTNWHKQCPEQVGPCKNFQNRTNLQRDGPDPRPRQRRSLHKQGPDK